ncbi:unnamed protein product, partial [marine sediment metagenome]
GHLFRELVLYRKNRNKLIKSMTGYLEFFEKLNKDDLLCIVNNGEGVLNIAAWLYCVKSKTKFIQNNWCGMIPGKRYMSKDILKNRWIKKEHYDKELTREENIVVKEFLNYSKEKKSIIGLGKLPILSLNNVKKFFGLLVDYYRDIKLINEIPSPFFFLSLHLIRYLNKIKSKRYHKHFDKTKKYFYFPLHEAFDSAVLINHYRFFRQDKVIENIAKALPEDYILYVKEHPVTIGTTPLRWIKNISKLRNVTIIPSTTNSHDIVKDCAGVITICSSTGWEALQYRKPVVTVDSPFYMADGLTLDVKDFENTDKLKMKINMAIDKKIDINKVYKLANAVIKSHYDGSYFTHLTNFDYEYDTIKKLADSTIKECEWEGDVL